MFDRANIPLSSRGVNGKRRGERMCNLKSVSINEKEQLFLDGEEITNVTAYRLESSAGEPAKLVVEMLVNVNQVGSGLQR